MGRSSVARWAALTAVVAICALTTPSAFAASPPLAGATVDVACPIWSWWCWSRPSPTPTPGAGTAAQPAATTAPSPSPTAAPAPTATPTPAPTPAPTAAPTPAPTATPGPTTAPTTPSPTPAPSASGPAGHTPAPAASPTPSAVPTRTALPAPGPSVAVLSSNTIQITNLRSLAVRTVTTAAGAVKVIDLQADATTITGLGLQGPCTGHTRVNTNATIDVATGGLTLDATALQATILGIPITIAAADLPEGAITLPGITLPTLPTNLGIVTVKLLVLSIRAGAMALQAPHITPAAC